ncbi:MAG TPA: hypothetical protein VFP72_21680 [Kineosporiaceae bacterium]|nr:hypothetical protein [Kineosporiaceae bacterium]
MTELPQPSAARLQRPSWRDTRLLVGLLIVLVSIAFGARVVAAADDTVPVYAAAGTLVTGRSLSSSDLVVVRVRLESGAANYLRAQSPPPAGATVLRTVGAGELVPVSAIGSAGAVQVRPVTVPVDGALPAGLRVGDRVDVWSSARDPAGGGSTYRPPVRVAMAAEVSAANRPDSGLSLAQGASVQVLLESTELPRVLDALANGARIALVPVPGAALPSAG